MATETEEQIQLPSVGNQPPLANLRAIKMVLFDLDGTLHDDPRVTDRYASILEDIIPDGGGQGLRTEAAAVAAGEHPALKPGLFAEPYRGIVVHAPEWTSESATDWEGHPVPVPDDLRGRVGHDGPLRYLGDSWQIIGTLAASRGADQRIQAEAFASARRFVNDHATSLIRSEHLDEVLDRLAPGRHLVLATNTPEQLARPLVDRLALRPPFAIVRFDARKPKGCAQLIVQARRAWGTHPAEVLVVGDNLWNDLLPPAGQGCRTVHIDPLGTDSDGRWSSARYDNFAAFAAALREIPDEA
ncbi:haloacid dehalogenase-like hydrolase [Arthrobacter subterraneus]|uniref:Haloacid dehalogenase-like hydrolase n=1 Tax=Arthrobacter subterraneus TaxID=335973 RepID=A0A1G8LE76_9MICC|nr:HAD family hydrolase [Arthrobacter subterraneus]SDI54018.1 haloacid dehalogenase-like hydrolase [Arthrobacter subterraneus]